MNASGCLAAVGLGSVLGAAGQIAHAIPGIKKMYDTGGTFDMSRFFVSLLIGAVAGTLASVGLLAANKLSVEDVGAQTLLALIGAGYAGTDFIEGFMGASGRPSNPATPSAVAPRSVPSTPA